jgi:hypothetical protein
MGSFIRCFLIHYSTWWLFFLWGCDPTQVMSSLFLRFLDHTQRCTTVGRTPLDEWSAFCRDLYLTTHNTHNRQISMPLVGFEPMISAGERSQTAWPLGSAFDTSMLKFILVSKTTLSWYKFTRLCDTDVLVVLSFNVFSSIWGYVDAYL